jgi:microcystin-dependent protein
LADLSQTAGSNFPSGGESPTSADDYLRTYAAFIATLRDGKGVSAEVDVASAATADIGAANSQFVRITGTVTVSSFGANYNGPRFIRFAGTLTLVNSATLILPGGVSMTTSAGDTCIAVPIGSPGTGWQIVSYQLAAASPSATPTGAIFHFPCVNAPTGFLKADGSLVSRTTYASLWAFAQASGNIAASDAAWTRGQFSPGDGSTTFRLPNVRGYHIRSFDDGDGTDAGRTIGSVQADQMPSHGHSATLTDPGHKHAVLSSTGNAINDRVGVQGGITPAVFSDGGDPNTASATTGISVSIGNSGTGTETRVKTIAYLACIKY